MVVVLPVSSPQGAQRGQDAQSEEERTHMGLVTGCLGCGVVRLAQTTSTNDVARDLAQRGAADGTLIVASEQSAGRGRRGRIWLAPPGTCLLCSFILRPDLTPAQAPRLTMLAAVSIVRALRAFAVTPVIKWPNDVLINGRKVAGVLTETSLAGDTLDWAIVGMGVNVNIVGAELALLSPQATSLLAETGQAIDLDHLLRLLLAEMDVRYLAMRRDGGQAVFAEWATLLETVGRTVRVDTGDREIAGQAESVGADGALRVRQENGEVIAVTFGDVS